MPEIIVYSKAQCPYCVNAKQLLKNKGYTYTEIDIGNQPELAIEVVKKSGQRTVPQIFVGEHCIGGFSDLVKVFANGEFDHWVHH